MKIGDKLYQWVFLHARNGEQFAGLVEVPVDLKLDDKFYKRCLAADIMQPKVMEEVTLATAGPAGDTVQVNKRTETTTDRMIELRNPHQVMIQVGQGKQAVSCLPLNLGDKLIYLRAGEIMFAQFLDDKSPIVLDIRQAVTGLVDPTAPKEGEERTEGGIILPGAVK